MKNINELPPIKQRFYTVFKATNKTQAEFGEVIGKSQNQISAILNNRRNISADMIQLMRYKFDVNPDFILHGKLPMFLQKKPPKPDFIPVLGSIPAGPWENWYDDHAEGSGDEYVPRLGIKGENLFAVRVKGDSMEPKLFEGDILVIDPHRGFDGGVAVVRHEEGYKIRNIRRLGGGKWLLIPLNNRYPVEEIGSGPDTRFYVPVKVVCTRDI